MVDPLERAEERTERVALDIAEGDLRFLERYAAYRNVMNDLTGRTVRAKWSRKSAAEAFVSAQIAQLMEQMREVFEEFGPLPEEPSELRKYAERVLARVDKPKKR